MYQEPVPPKFGPYVDDRECEGLDAFGNHKVEDFYFHLLSYAKELEASGNRIVKPDINSQEPTCLAEYDLPRSLKKSMFEHVVRMSLLMSYPLFEIHGSVLWLSSYKELALAEEYFADPNMSDFERTIREASWNSREILNSEAVLVVEPPFEVEDIFHKVLFCGFGFFRYVYTLRLKSIFPDRKFKFLYGSLGHFGENAIMMYEDRGALDWTDIVAHPFLEEQDVLLHEGSYCYEGKKGNYKIPLILNTTNWGFWESCYEIRNEKGEYPSWEGKKWKPIPEDFSF